MTKKTAKYTLLSNFENDRFSFGFRKFRKHFPINQDKINNNDNDNNGSRSDDDNDNDDAAEKTTNTKTLRNARKRTGCETQIRIIISN